MKGRGWGATKQEAESALIGDSLVPGPDFVITRAITVHARAPRVWPWIAQLGQQAGGFYSYDRLENLVGCQIHNADRIHPEWQAPSLGDQVRLYPQGGLAIAELERGTAMVLHGGLVTGKRPPPFDFSWAFVLVDGPGTSCRLLVRERYSYERRWAPLVVRPTALISTVMTRKTLLGIKDRAERTHATLASLPLAGTDTSHGR